MRKTNELRVRACISDCQAVIGRESSSDVNYSIPASLPFFLFLSLCTNLWKKRYGNHNSWKKRDTEIIIHGKKDTKRAHDTEIG